jgi:hypothetical protein
MRIELLLAELLTRPGQRGPLARPLWPRRAPARPPVPKAAGVLLQPQERTRR